MPIKTPDAPFQDNQVMKVTGYQNNCALNVILHQFKSDLLTGRLSSKMLKQPIYQNMLSHYQTYHGNPKVTWRSLTRWINKHQNEPITLEVRLGPILRLTLGNILKDNGDFRATRRQEFLTYIRAALTNPAKIDHTYYAMSEACHKYVLQLYQNFHRQFDASEEDALNTFIAQHERAIATYWNETGYNAFVDFLCNPINEQTLDPSDAAQLIKALNYNMILYRGENKQYWAMDDDEPLASPLATISIYNRTDTHYECIAETAEIAEVHNGLFDAQAPRMGEIVARYHGGKSRELSSQYQALIAKLNQAALSLLAWSEGDEKPQSLFRRANHAFDSFFESGGEMDEATFTQYWDAMSQSIQSGNQSELEAVETAIQADTPNNNPTPAIKPQL